MLRHCCGGGAYHILGPQFVDATYEQVLGGALKSLAYKADTAMLCRRRYCCRVGGKCGGNGAVREDDTQNTGVVTAAVQGVSEARDSVSAEASATTLSRRVTVA